MRYTRNQYGPHSVHQLYLHLVFATYNREGLITPKRKDRLRTYFEEICSDIRCEVIECETGRPNNSAKKGDDHVHLVLRYTPTLSVAALAQKLKGVSSYRMTADEKISKHLREADAGDFRWSSSYFAKTIGHKSARETAEYARAQEEKKRARRRGKKAASG